jgi:hypothetical protein
MDLVPGSLPWWVKELVDTLKKSQGCGHGSESGLTAVDAASQVEINKRDEA